MCVCVRVAQAEILITGDVTLATFDKAKFAGVVEGAFGYPAGSVTVTDVKSNTPARVLKARELANNGNLTVTFTVKTNSAKVRDWPSPARQRRCL
jgi:hypothetical protein